MFSLIKISRRVKSKFFYLDAPRYLASVSAVMYPRWLSSIPRKAFLTELKSVDSFIFSLMSSCLTYSATFYDFKEPDMIVVPPIDIASALVFLACA